MVRETQGRLFHLADDCACQGDDPEITSLGEYWALGTTPETRINLTAAMALGIANVLTDNSL